MAAPAPKQTNRTSPSGKTTPTQTMPRITNISQIPMRIEQLNLKHKPKTPICFDWGVRVTDSNGGRQRWQAYARAYQFNGDTLVDLELDGLHSLLEVINAAFVGTDNVLRELGTRAA